MILSDSLPQNFVSIFEDIQAEDIVALRPAAPLVFHVKCSEMYLNANRNHSQQKPLWRRE